MVGGVLFAFIAAATIITVLLLTRKQSTTTSTTSSSSSSTGNIIYFIHRENLDEQSLEFDQYRLESYVELLDEIISMNVT